MLKKIAAEKLRPGMYLQALCGSWIDHPFWRSKFVIIDPKDIRQIIDYGITEVWINLDMGADESSDAPAPVAMPAVTPNPVTNPKKSRATTAAKAVSMSDELQRAEKICHRAKNAVISMFQEVRMGKAISSDTAHEVVQEISLSVMRHPGALISLARLKTADDYTYMHSVAVCALMVALSHQLNLDEQQTREAGMAGLLHDLGKALMPTEILNKPGRLTEGEFAIMRGHPEAGHRLLQESNFVGEIPLDVCLHHHERIDGSGYPHGLNGSQISLFAKMGAVCDVYDAITSNRPYKAGWEPVESIQKMTEWCAAQYDEGIFQAFVHSIGIYPIGSLVRLSSGRLGVVIEQSEKSVIKPKVKVFFSTKSGMYIPPEIIDLSRPTIDCKAEKIISHEDAKKWSIKNFNHM
ncbi:MAG: HD-GYP domain-containing protein, partial [Burkholderiaceae bacterium]|nr:HD-GYP domain-containing protein [Burkholderiaceae bacterium]